MGSVRDSTWYDEQFLGNAEYAKPPELSIYWHIWKRVIDMVPREANVLELGCGTGQVAKALSDRGVRSYVGIDFSHEAIRQAKERNHDLTFVQDLVCNAHCYSYDTVIGLEVLEHIDDDLVTVENIHSGSLCILSVPDFDGPSHVRFFETEDVVALRYSKYFKDLSVEKIELWPGQNIFVLRGVRI